jgi:tyrosine-specific transport protein
MFLMNSASAVLAKRESVLGSMLLITGCCIGAGTIGLPVLSAVSGFIPSSLAMLFSYLFTTAMGLLLLEATLWFDQKVNLLSIAEFALGSVGKWLTGFLFLFLFYSIFVAYVDGGGQLFSDFLSTLCGRSVPRIWGSILWTGVGALIVYMGTRAVDYANRFLIIGLIASFALLLFASAPHVRLENLQVRNWSASLNTLPIMFICFGYQNLVPSLTYYLQKNVRSLRLAICVGNLIPFFLYSLWNFVILGVIPPTALNSHSNIVSDLLTQTSSVLFYVKSFSFFVMITSFIAIAITFVDFLKDGFNYSSIELAKLQKLLIYSLVFLPPLIFSFFYTNVFLKALEIAGGFTDILLFGVLPAIVVWIGRYRKKVQGPYTVGGGKAFLSLVLLFSFLLISLRFF